MDMGSSLQPDNIKSAKKKKENVLQEKNSFFSNQNKVKYNRGKLQSLINAQDCIRKETVLSRDGKVLGNYFMNKRIHCFKCKELVYKRSMSIHSKYYCGADHDEKEWKLCGRLAFCKKCNRTQEPDSIEFHVSYLCQKKPIHVQCFYCPRIFQDYRGLLRHTNHTHHKKHKFQDLISILPPAECLSSVEAPVKIVKNFFSNYLNTTEEANSEIDSSANVCFQVRKKTTHECRSCGKILVGTHAYENHINTQCEAENQYFCFFCLFKADYPYQVLDHMEVDHNKKFNTFDLIQAKLTGIIPITDPSSTELIPEDNEVVFANSQLFEPYIPEVPIFQKEINSSIKADHNRTLRKRKISGKDEIQNTQNGHDSSKNLLVDKKSERSIKSLTKSNQKSVVDMVKKNGVHKIEFMRNISLNVLEKKIKVEKNVISGKRGTIKSITKETCSKCQVMVNPGYMSTHMKYHCGTNVINDWVLQCGKALCLRCEKFQSASTIEFHTRFLCKRKMFSVQCFYCPKIASNYRSLLVHMSKGHNKVHYYQDFMTVLPAAECILMNPTNSVGGTSEQNVVKHPFIYGPPKKECFKSDPTSSKFPLVDNFYDCFYCTFKSKAAFKALNHMEETHKRNHNIYELLTTKMDASYHNK